MILPVIQSQLILLHDAEHTGLYLHFNPALSTMIDTQNLLILLQFKLRIALLHMHIRETDHHTRHDLIYSHNAFSCNVIHHQDSATLIFNHCFYVIPKICNFVYFQIYTTSL